MPSMELNTLKSSVSNADILNAIRKDASPDYFRRIPEATQANIQDVLQNLTKYRPLWNEFADSLINRIGLVIVKSNMWTNPYSKFKRGMLEFGDTIEEINVGLIRARVYNADREYLERDIFGNYPPEVQSSFHKINRQEFYPISVNEPLLQRAFLENNGLSGFIAAVMNAPLTSDQWDEFMNMCSLFTEYYKAGGFFKIQVDDVTGLDSTAVEAKTFLRRVREMSGNLQFMSSLYNAAGMPMAVNPDDLELFITPEALAAIDVEALAAAFNIDKANMPARINIIPKTEVRIPGFQAVLTTRDFFVIADARIETTSAYNPVTLSNNYFLHHWQVISASRFTPAILFTTEAGTVLEIEDTPVTGVSALTVNEPDGDVVTSVQRGSLYQVVGAATTEGDNDAVRLTVSGNESNKTYITQSGVLHVSPDETADTLVVKAFATDSGEPQFSSEVSVTVVGDLLDLWPTPEVLPDADNDGVEEVTPKDLTKTVEDTVIIPSVTGVQYQKNGVNVTNGSVQTVEAVDPAVDTFTAVPRSGYEFTAGATTSWTFSVTA